MDEAKTVERPSKDTPIDRWIDRPTDRSTESEESYEQRSMKADELRLISNDSLLVLSITILDP